MSPIQFGQPDADCGAGFTEQHHSRAIPFRVRVDPAVCMDHDDLMANIIEQQRRRDDDGDGRRKRPGKRQDKRRGYYDKYGKFRPYQDQRGPRSADQRRADRPRDCDRPPPRYDGYGGRRDDRYDDRYERPDRYRGEQHAAEDKTSGTFWASMKNTAIGLGGIAALGGGGFLALTGVMNMVHSAGRSPSFMLIAGGAVLALAGMAALKAAFKDDA
ncbi:MAG: hypothetical protein ACAI38_13890 [Myxococcota bacterium]